MREIVFYSALMMGCLMALKDPFKGILGYTLINIVRPEIFFWGGNTGALAFKALFLSTVVGFIAKKKGLVQAASYREVWLILWIFLAVMCSLWLSDWAPHPRAYYHATEFFKFFVYAWIMIGSVEKREDLKRFETLFLGAFTILALWGWQQHFLGNARLEGLGGQSFTDSNGVAATFDLCIPLAFSRTVGAKTTKGKLVAWGCVVALAMAVVFTQSRGGFLGLAAGLLLCFLRFPGKAKFLGAAALLLVLVSPFIDSAYVNRISGITDDEIAEKDGSAGSRLVLWQAGLLMFRDKPLFGHGFMTFARAKAPYRAELAGKFPDKLLEYAFEPYKVCHGTYFNLLAEGGLFLFLPYVLFVAGFLWKYAVNRKRVVTSSSDPEGCTLLDGIALGVASHCVAILTIDSQMDIFMPIQIVCGGMLLRFLLQEVPQGEGVAAAREGVI